MKKNYKWVSHSLKYIVAVMFVFTIFSCTSSQYSTSRETDGVYYNPRTDASAQQYSSNETYKEDGTIKVGGVYFDSKGDGPEEFYYEDEPITNTAQASASPVIVNTNRNVYVLETSAYQNNPSWGKQTGVDITVNNWGGYGYGGYPYWGWNSWYGPSRAWYGGYYGVSPYWSLGWNSWYGMNWGMGYYGGYYGGGYWGNSWYHDRPYYNDYYYGRNRAYSRYSSGNSINTGRQPSYGGRESAMGIRPNTPTREVRPSTSVGTRPSREVRPSTSIGTERPTREVRPNTSINTERPTREVRPSTSVGTEHPTREVRPNTSINTERPTRTTTPSVNTQRSSQSGNIRSNNNNYSTPSRTPSYSSPSRSSGGSMRSSGSVSPSRGSSTGGGGSRRR